MVSQGLSPALWGMGAPYGVFTDGVPKPAAEWGGFDPNDMAAPTRLLVTAMRRVAPARDVR